MSNKNPYNSQNNIPDWYDCFERPPQRSVLISMGGAGAGKDTTIKEVQKKFQENGKIVTAPVSFLLSAKNNDGSYNRSVRIKDGKGENNRIWITPKIKNMMEKAGIIATDTPIGIGYEKGGYDYITATEFDKKGKHREIWEEIIQESENQKNPSFTEIEDKTLAIKNAVDSGDIVFLEGHAVGWYETITKKLSDLGLSTIGLGWVGMSEKTSFERQTLNRGDAANTTDEIKRQQGIELAKSKAQDAMEQQKEILKHRDNAKKDPSLPPFYTFGAIGKSKKEMVAGILRDKSPEQIKADIEEFTKTRTNYIFELANRQHNFNVAEFNLDKIQMEQGNISDPKYFAKSERAGLEYKIAQKNLKALGEYGVEGWNEIRNGENGQEVKNNLEIEQSGINEYYNLLLAKFKFRNKSHTQSPESKAFLKEKNFKIESNATNFLAQIEAEKLTNTGLLNLYLQQNLKEYNFPAFKSVLKKEMQKQEISEDKKVNLEILIDNIVSFENFKEKIKYANLEISHHYQNIIGQSLRNILERRREKEVRNKNSEKLTETGSEMEKSKPKIA